MDAQFPHRQHRYHPAGAGRCHSRRYVFSRYKFTGRDVSMFAFLLVQMFPGIIILVPYFLVMKSLGLLNSHLGLILAYCVTGPSAVRVDVERLL